MAIEVKNQAAIPAGQHTGEIVSARETTKTFNPQEGPEPVVEITIAPEWTRDDGAETLPVSVIFAPVLNGISALSGLLQRLGQTPKAGSAWKPTTLVGTRVNFTAFHADNGFVRVVKDSITAAE